MPLREKNASSPQFTQMSLQQQGRAMLSRGAPLTLRRTPATSLGLLSRRLHAHCTTTHMSGVGGGISGVPRRGAIVGALGVPRTLHMSMCLRSGAPESNGRPTATQALAAGDEEAAEAALAWPFQWGAWEDFLHQCVAAGCFLEYEGVVMPRSDVRAESGLVPELGDAPAHKRGVLEFARKYGYLLECVPPILPILPVGARVANDADEGQATWPDSEAVLGRAVGRLRMPCAPSRRCQRPMAKAASAPGARVSPQPSVSARCSVRAAPTPPRLHN